MDPICARDAEGAKWFHISTKGIDRNLFKSSADFHHALNIIAICAEKFNVGIIAYCLMSNHIHTAIKALSELIAANFIDYVKQSYSRYNMRVHNEAQIFDKVPVSIKELKTSQDLRNCIAYILRNPVEARICSNADQYPWSSYGCYFNSDSDFGSLTPVCSLPKRVTRTLLRTHQDMSSSKLYVSDAGDIIPGSFVESEFVESLYGNSRDELAKHISFNPYLALEYELSNPVKLSLPHYELVRVASELAMRKFGRNLSALSMNERVSMVMTLNSDYKAGAYQICQILSLSRKTVNQILGLPVEK